MSDEHQDFRELIAQLEKLKAENLQLKKGFLTMSVSDKMQGMASLHGLGRFPINLYPEQWEKLFLNKDMIMAFIQENHSALTKRTPKANTVGPRDATPRNGYSYVPSTTKKAPAVASAHSADDDVGEEEVEVPKVPKGKKGSKSTKASTKASTSKKAASSSSSSEESDDEPAPPPKKGGKKGGKKVVETDDEDVVGSGDDDN